jgi:ribosomal protein S18 acetylase RimI-like enzyme
MPPQIEVLWPRRADAASAAAVHRVLHDVAELGGAIGYLVPPAPPETGGWLGQVLVEVRAGDAALAVARVDGVVQALGLWRRCPDEVFAHSAEVQRVVAHPSAWGQGLGRLIVGALIDDARRAGIETLDLGVRGNNHGAIELYESLGFRVWGRRPNVVEVGDDRYDEVRMVLTLGHSPGTVLRGSLPGGAGWSPPRSFRLVAGPVEAYLHEDEIVDWTDSPVAALARALRRAAPSPVGFARSAFEHVRDNVAHSVDAADPRVTLTASQTLAHGVGLCYAKSHLLVALLRAEGVPAGLCYQRLCDDDGGHVVHGLVAVHLAGGWHRLDPRGNRPGIDARFSLASECLAWSTRPELGEIDYPRVYADPHPAVVAVLRTATDALALVRDGLPSRL